MNVVLLNAGSASQIPLWSMIPFVLMLLMIAIGPLFAERWWGKNSHKLTVALVLGVPVAVFMINNGMTERLEEQLLFDYVPFVVLLVTLYVVTGGIRLCGSIRPTPEINTELLALGYVMASFLGTTGASMLFIRPLLDINAKRQYKVHTILFFIALVANCGGLLTPLGDPPLFMLYLRGASFGWFLSMLPQWLFTGLVLLSIYYLVDKFHYSRKEDKASFELPDKVEPIRIRGSRNCVLLLIVIVAVAFINKGFIPRMADPDAPLWIKYLREIVLVSVAILSYRGTSPRVRFVLNRFSWAPILEVCVLFLGIFTTMSPALAFMEQKASSLGITQPWQFYFSTGALSSVLDNTPTAVAFYSLASGLQESLAAATAGISSGSFMGLHFVAGVPEVLLRAISIGSVFFGAMTYIGNGPNLMVKSIAESRGVKMPSFFGYILKFSLIVLLPLYIMLYFIFF
ncbi:MAG: sodium:proton antiporter [Candidatus Cryptobacteroides sp.]